MKVVFHYPLEAEVYIGLAVMSSKDMGAEFEIPREVGRIIDIVKTKIGEKDVWKCTAELTDAKYIAVLKLMMAPKNVSMGHSVEGPKKRLYVPPWMTRRKKGDN